MSFVHDSMEAGVRAPKVGALGDVGNNCEESEATMFKRTLSIKIFMLYLSSLLLFL
jgi:hypothetical protein